MKVPVRISKGNSRTWRYYLRRRYNKPRMELSNLMRLAVQEIIMDQAERELEELLPKYPI